MYTTYQDPNLCFFLLELVQGGELFSRLAAQPEGWVSDYEAVFHAACVCEAIDYMHSHDTLYRDIKVRRRCAAMRESASARDEPAPFLRAQPENLLLDTTGYIRVVDFGFAKVVRGQTHTVCGTPEYLSPEVRPLRSVVASRSRP